MRGLECLKLAIVIPFFEHFQKNILDSQDLFPEMIHLILVK